MKTNEKNKRSDSAFADVYLASCWKLLAEIERAKSVIFSEFRDRFEEDKHLLGLAINEAEALAWQTDYPHLFFPTLAMEKADALAKWHVRQRSMQQTNASLALAA